MTDNPAISIQSKISFLLNSTVSSSVQRLGIHHRDKLENENIRMFSPVLFITA